MSPPRNYHPIGEYSLLNGLGNGGFGESLDDGPSPEGPSDDGIQDVFDSAQASPATSTPREAGPEESAPPDPTDGPVTDGLASIKAEPPERSGPQAAPGAAHRPMPSNAARSQLRPSML